MAWLTEEDLNQQVEVVNHDGDFLGWTTQRESHILNLPLQFIETPPHYKEHPLLIHHAKMAHANGILGDGRDLSEVQSILLASVIIHQNQDAETLRERFFEESMFINNPEGFKAYQEYKEQKNIEEIDGVLIEERVPQNIEEFLAALGAFDESPDGEDEGEDGDFGGLGWLASMLSEEDINEMGE